MLIRLLFYLFIISYSIPAITKDFPGYYINKQGEKIETIFKIPTYIDDESPKFINLSYGIKHYVNGKTTKLKPEECEKVVFKYMDKEIVYISLPNIFLRTRHKFVFMRPKISGPANLFYYYLYKNQNSGGMNLLSTSAGQEWIIEKEGEIVKISGGGARRRDLADIFSDYEEFAEKILSKEIKSEDIKNTEKMVRTYNDWKLKQTERTVVREIDKKKSSYDTITKHYTHESISLTTKRNQVFYKDRLLSNTEVLEFYQDFPEITDLYSKGYKYRKVGKPLMIVGIASVSASYVLITASTFSSSNNGYAPTHAVGNTLSIMGHTMIPIAIILKVMGANKISGSVDLYNKRQQGFSKRPNLEYELGIVSSGVGLKVRF